MLNISPRKHILQQLQLQSNEETLNHQINQHQSQRTNTNPPTHQHTNMSISDNNMGGESHSVRMPELSGPIYEPTRTPNNSVSTQDLTSSQAETYPTWSRKSSGSNDKALDTSTSNESTTNSRSVAYAESTNTEPAGLSAYDHGKDTSTSATPSSSRSRSRSRGEYDVHRVSQDGRRPGFPEDTEAKHKRRISKFLDHKLAPSFLK